MQKKLVAVAVAGALAAPALAFAQASTVQIYGNIRVDYNIVDPGAGRPNFDGFSAYDSSLSVRGSEKLGGGITAWFQCESTANVTGEDMNTLCNRNSGVGFRGNYGNIFVGNWDTPYKLANGTHFRPFSTSGSFGLASLLYNGSTGNGGNGLLATGALGGDTIGTSGTATQVAGFSRRQANTINYHSPTWNGFRFMGAFSAIDETTQATNATTASKPRLYSLGAIYQNGPLAIGVGWEGHKDYNPAANAAYIGGDDRAWAINAGYTFAKVFRLSGVYTDTRYEHNTAVTAQTAKVKAWGIYGDWKIQGPHTLRVGYTDAGDVKGNSTVSIANYAAAGGDTGANLFGIQYAYAFSKRTELNLGYAKLNNDRLSRHVLQSLAARNTGQDQDALVIGVRHSF